jgi:hypothetical protein
MPPTTCDLTFVSRIVAAKILVNCLPPLLTKYLVHRRVRSDWSQSKRSSEKRGFLIPPIKGKKVSESVASVVVTD